MILYGSVRSPYARKCRVAAHELGIGDQLELTRAPSSGNSVNMDSDGKNPVGKIPTLIMEDGQPLFDSRIIIRYLNELAGGELFPSGDWAMLRRESQAEGLMDAAILIRYETHVRPPDSQWDFWSDAQTQKVRQILDAMEHEADTLERLDAAAITTACGLSYLDFRNSDLDWRTGRPGLTSWFAEFETRPSMQSTMPS